MLWIIKNKIYNYNFIYVQKIPIRKNVKVTSYNFKNYNKIYNLYLKKVYCVIKKRKYNSQMTQYSNVVYILYNMIKIINFKEKKKMLSYSSKYVQRQQSAT